MAKDFKLVSSYIGGEPTIIMNKASTTVIEAGDMVALASGLVVKATAASAAIGYAPYGAIAGETTIKVLDDKDAIFEGTGDEVFAVAQKGAEVDIVVTGGVQLIDVGASTKDVFKIDASQNAGTVGSTAGIRVRINKPIY